MIVRTPTDKTICITKKYYFDYPEKMVFVFEKQHTDIFQDTYSYNDLIYNLESLTDMSLPSYSLMLIHTSVLQCCQIGCFSAKWVVLDCIMSGIMDLDGGQDLDWWLAQPTSPKHQYLTTCT